MARTKFHLIYLAPLMAFALLACRPAPSESQPGSPPDLAETAAGEPSAAAPTPTPVPTPEPTPEFVHDPSSRVTVLGYHRFEEKPRDGLAISPEDFRKQLQTLKDNDIAVIGMEDFLAWKRGEKNIPPRCAVLTIDDGYNCSYLMAWPILQEFEYPFTMYVYLNYISAGGRSITWEQLEEMRDAGVDIGSHSVSHASLTARKGRSDAQYQEFLTDELKRSKDEIERHLGIQVLSYAFAYGHHNDQAIRVGMDAGYEALFTVHGQIVGHSTPNEKIGRYVVLSDKPQVFEMAVNFGGGSSGGAAPVSAYSIPSEPAPGSVIADPSPEISADLTVLGNIDPASVEMRISGFGVVPAKFDPATNIASYKITRRLAENTYSIILSAMADGKKVQTRWEFRLSYDAPAAPETL